MQIGVTANQIAKRPLYPREEVEQRSHFGDEIALRRNSAFISNFQEVFKLHSEYARKCKDYYTVHLLKSDE